MPLTKIGFTPLFGFTIVGWLGVLALTSLVATAAVGFLNARGNRTIPFSYHKKLAFLTLVLALIHATLALSAYVG